jgi:Mlc titration factor MtfA (ptsG expression regulator)
MQNGDSNGFPPLHRDMQAQTWTKIFSTAYEDFYSRCEHGESIGIDAYAAESPTEFFAVLSEVFFERPDILDRYYPAVYAQLRLYYRQDPLQSVRRQTRQRR